MNDKEISQLLQSLLSQNDSENQKLSKLIQDLAKSDKNDATNIHKSSSHSCIVLGMHRSGTSALAGLLNLMGFWVGEEIDILQSDNDNPKGYFERKDVIKLNAQLLKSQNCNWHTGLHNFDPLNWQPDVKKDFLVRSSKIVEQLDNTNKPWLLKDPRLCLTFSIWREVIPEAIPIIMYRDPSEVSASLHKRDKFSIPFALSLWEKYNLDALKNTNEMKRIAVSYQQLVTDPVAVVSYLFEELSKRGVKGLVMPEESQIFNFVDPSLNRSKKDVTGNLLTENQQKLYDGLQNKTALLWDEKSIPKLSDEARTILKEL